MALQCLKIEVYCLQNSDKYRYVRKFEDETASKEFLDKRVFRKIDPRPSMDFWKWTLVLCRLRCQLDDSRFSHRSQGKPPVFVAAGAGGSTSRL
jgi:hypothetical protein